MSKISNLLEPFTGKSMTKSKHAAALVKGGKVLYIRTSQPGLHAETQVLRSFEKRSCLQGN